MGLSPDDLPWDFSIGVARRVLCPGRNGAKLSTPYFQGVAPWRTPTQAGSLCYATLRRRVVAVGARNSAQKAFRQIARHSGEHCSIGFQPVAGVRGLKPG